VTDDVPPWAGYLHRPGPEPRHRCPLPAEWFQDAVWMCPDGHLWTVRRVRVATQMREYDLAWRPASWWMRRRYRDSLDPGRRLIRRARMAMADPSGVYANGVRGTDWLAAHPPPKRTPPVGPSGQSLGKDGCR
jgi:hypothetical protein